MRAGLLGLGGLLLATAGCSKSPEVEKLRNLPNAPGGNPLVPEVALFPWPSDFYLADAPGSRTGKRLAIPDEAMPDNVFAEDFADDDGFTRAPTVLTWFEAGVDPQDLPTLAGSIDPQSAIALIDATTLERIPFVAELDAHATGPENQSLILRPQVTLRPATRHVVVIRDGLHGLDGAPLAPTDAFRALRDQIPTDSSEVESQRADFRVVSDTLSALEIDPATVVQAWPFTTRSEEQVVGPGLSMHDQVMAQTLAPWVPVSDENDGDNRLIEGEIQVLDFLGSDGRIQVDADGQAIPEGNRTVRFLVTIPNTVDRTRPVIAFGHGFFSSYQEPTWGSLQHAVQPWQMSAISTDFIGFNETDAIRTVSLVAGGIGGLGEVSDQQLQSHVHFTALARLVREQLANDISDPRGFDPLDGDAVHYMGISNGGTQGAVIVASSPALTRGALVVPGGGWSHMMQRAVQWGTMGGLLADQYPEPRELQVVLSLTQQLLDPVDALNYAPHLTDDPFPGRSPNEVTLHMAVGDAQVANLVTEWVARSAGIPLITPSARAVPLIDEVSAAPPAGWSGTSGLFVYDEGYPPLPEGNQAPLEDNGAHETIRDLDAYLDQVGAFLEDGTIAQVCDGPCDPG